MMDPCQTTMLGVFMCAHCVAVSAWPYGQKLQPNTVTAAVSAAGCSALAAALHKTLATCDCAPAYLHVALSPPAALPQDIAHFCGGFTNSQVLSLRISTDIAGMRKRSCTFEGGGVAAAHCIASAIARRFQALRLTV